MCVDGENKKSSFYQDLLILSKFINSGVLQWTLISYPFQLQIVGGALYFIVSIILSVTVVQPVLANELAVGQLNQKGLINVWGNMVPVFKGVGYASTLVSFYILGTAGCLCALGVYYLSRSFESPLPWTQEDTSLSFNVTNATYSTLEGPADTFYKQVAFSNVIDIQEDLGAPHLHLWISLAVAYICFIILLLVSLKYSWAFSFTSFALCFSQYLIVLVLFVGALLNGASPVLPEWRINSISTLFTPNFWLNILLRMFITLPLGIGSGIKLGSQNHIHSDFSRTAMYLCLCGPFTDILVGTFLYTILTHLGELMGTSPEQLYSVGFGVIFKQIPYYLSTFHCGTKAFTIAYFILILIAGVASILMMFQRLSSLITEKFPNVPSALVIFLTGCIGFLGALPFLSSHGMLLLSITGVYGIYTFKIFLVLLQLLTIFMYQPRKFFADWSFMTQSKVNFWSRLVWLVVLFGAVITLLWKFQQGAEFLTFEGRPLPTWALVSGITLLSMVGTSLILPGSYEIFKLWMRSSANADDDTVFGNFKKCFKGKEKFGPSNEQDRIYWIEFKETQKWLRKTRNHPLQFGQWV